MGQSLSSGRYGVSNRAPKSGALCLIREPCGQWVGLWGPHRKRAGSLFILLLLAGLAEVDLLARRIDEAGGFRELLRAWGTGLMVSYLKRRPKPLFPRRRPARGTGQWPAPAIFRYPCLAACRWPPVTTTRLITSYVVRILPRAPSSKEPVLRAGARTPPKHGHTVPFAQIGRTVQTKPGPNGNTSRNPAGTTRCHSWQAHKKKGNIHKAVGPRPCDETALPPVHPVQQNQPTNRVTLGSRPVQPEQTHLPRIAN